MMKKRTDQAWSERGFTIVELMIATAVLSTILIMVTVVMVNIGRLYYKGMNQSRVQGNVRTITDEIAAHLKLGEDFFRVSSGNQQAYCIGNIRYTFVMYRQIGDKTAEQQSPHVLWRDRNPEPGSCSSDNLPNLSQPVPSEGGTEMIAPKSRLTALNISGDSPYNVSVGVAYGDNDLLCDTGYSGDCKPDSSAVHMNQIISGAATPTGQIRCKGDVGDQYCATAALQTTVTRRLPAN